MAEHLHEVQRFNSDGSALTGRGWVNSPVARCTCRAIALHGRWYVPEETVQEMVAALEEVVEGDSYGQHEASCRVDGALWGKSQPCTCYLAPLWHVLACIRGGGDHR